MKILDKSHNRPKLHFRERNLGKEAFTNYIDKFLAFYCNFCHRLVLDDNPTTNSQAMNTPKKVAQSLKALRQSPSNSALDTITYVKPNEVSI